MRVRNEPSPRPCPRVEGVAAVRERCADLLRDESMLEATGAERVYFPESALEVAAAVREAREAGSPLTLSAARTGIVGGAVPVDTAWVLSLSRMNRVLEIGADADGAPFARVEAGVTLDELARALAAFDWTTLAGDAASQAWEYPVDPTELTATVGGTVATDASGGRSFRHGSTRRWVRALTVVLADGRTVEVRRGEVRARDGVLAAPELFGDFADNELALPSIARPACKCAAGYFVEPDADLVDILIGSEGTLAVVAEIELALAPAPANVLALLCFLPEGADGLALVRELKTNARLHPLAIEYFDAGSLDLVRDERRRGRDNELPALPDAARSAVLLEQDYADDNELEARVAAVEEMLDAAGGSLDDTWAGDDDATREKIRLVRHAVPEAVNSCVARRRREVPTLHKVGTDLVVPDEGLNGMLRAYRELLPASGLEHVVFGHAGENHLHVNFMPRTEDELARAKQLHIELARKAVELGGAVTGEHGIGRLKRELLDVQYGAAGVAELRRVKDFFDPEGLLNPGVMFALT